LRFRACFAVFVGIFCHVGLMVVSESVSDLVSDCVGFLLHFTPESR